MTISGPYTKWRTDIHNVGYASWQSVRPQKTTVCSDATATIPPYKHSTDKNSQRHTKQYDSCCVAPQTAPFETSLQLLWSFLFRILFKSRTPSLIGVARINCWCMHHCACLKPHNGVYLCRLTSNLWPRGNSGVSVFVIGNRYIAVKTYRAAVHLCLVSACNKAVFVVFCLVAVRLICL